MIIESIVTTHEFLWLWWPRSSSAACCMRAQFIFHQYPILFSITASSVWHTKADLVHYCRLRKTNPSEVFIRSKNSQQNATHSSNYIELCLLHAIWPTDYVSKHVNSEWSVLYFKLQVNAELAAKLMMETSEGVKKAKTSQGELLEDDRFKSMFQDPAFAIDQNADDYKVLHPNAGKHCCIWFYSFYEWYMVSSKNIVPLTALFHL